MRIPKQRVIIIVAAALLVLTALVHLANNRVRVTALAKGSDLTIPLDESIPSGEYTLYYYIAASSANTSVPAMEFSLQADTLPLAMNSYTTAVGFGATDLSIGENQVITASFTHPENDKEAATYAAVGDVYIQSKDGRFQKRLYTPSSWGKKTIDNPRLTFYPLELHANLPVSHFAELTNYSMKNGTLALTFLCKESITEVYEIGLKVATDNINNIRPDGVRYSFHKLTNSEEGWIQGEEYTQSISLNLSPGNYNVDLMLAPRDTENVHNVKVSQLADHQNKISVGSFSIEGQTLAHYVNQLKDGQVILISIKDEGTAALNALSKKALSSLGLQEDLSDKYRWSYLAVTAKGVDGFVPFENLSQEHIQSGFPEGSLFGTFALPFDLELESAGYEVGNKASIIIDGTEYAKQSRGLNIVIYDLQEGKVVDQVAFDTCARNFRYQ